MTLALAAIIVLGLFGLGFSGGVGDNYVDLEDPTGPRVFDLVVTGFDGDSATFEGSDVSRVGRAGIWGLDYPNGYGQLTDVVSDSDTSVTRRLTVSEGDAPVTGTVARLDVNAWRGGPASAGLASTDVSYTTELGSYPAWLIGPASDMWVIYVHHKGASRDEGLRMAQAATEAGARVLVITYRNDREAPAGPAGTYRWGTAEYRDLEGAVRYAADNGADTIVVAGTGMGGSIALAFLERSEEAGRVDGLILDAPVIDLDETVAHDLAQDQLGAVFDLPTAFNASARLIAGWRFDLDWSDLDYSDVAPGVPTLIFHGDGDLVTPLGVSQAFAARYAEVDLVTVAGAGFNEAWNVDPSAYTATVAAFLDAL